MSDALSEWLRLRYAVVAVDLPQPERPAAPPGVFVRYKHKPLEAFPDEIRREAALMYIVGGHGLKEIAEVVGCTGEGVRHWVKKMEKEMEAKGDAFRPDGKYDDAAPPGGDDALPVSP